MIVIYDIETISNFFSYCALDKETQEIYTFVIHKDRDDRDKLLDHLKELKGMIGFNNLSFDSQVLHYFIKIADKIQTAEELANNLYLKAQKTIELSNSKGFPEIPEWKLFCSQMDLFLIHHFNNENKRVSLKWIEYMIDMDNIEEMPVKHYENVTKDQFGSIINYNINDVKATYELYKLTKGETEHPLYKGIDKIQLRKDIQKEFGINCINYNDVKIGDSLNKLNYCRIKGIDKKDISKSNKEISEFTFGNCFPNYMEFKTEKFTNFVNAIRNVKIKIL